MMIIMANNRFLARRLSTSTTVAFGVVIIIGLLTIATTVARIIVHVLVVIAVFLFLIGIFLLTFPILIIVFQMGEVFALHGFRKESFVQLNVIIDSPSSFFKHKVNQLFLVFILILLVKGSSISDINESFLLYFILMFVAEHSQTIELILAIFSCIVIITGESVDVTQFLHVVSHDNLEVIRMEQAHIMQRQLHEMGNPFVYHGVTSAKSSIELSLVKESM